MKNNLIYINILCVFFLLGCSKYFDYRPDSTSVNPTSVNDLKEVLNTDSNAICNFMLTDVVTDDDSISPDILTTKSSYITRAYAWEKHIWTADENDQMYNGTYNRILQMNVVLQRIDNAPLDSNSTEADRAIVKSQAKINRAFYYLQLTNIYAPAYQSSTANELSVPLITTPDAAQYPSRSTMAQVYALILSDLHEAAADIHLPTDGQDILHPGKAAAFALLSRAYLYRAQYDSAKIYADSVLALKNQLQDYNSTYKQTTQLQDLDGNPEVLLAKIGISVDYYSATNNSFLGSSSLFNVLSTSDIRRIKFFKYSYSYYTVGTAPQNLVFDYSISIPEVMLTKAECLARAGQNSEAVALLDTLRSKRSYSWSFYPTAFTSSTDLLSQILTERRRELLYHGGLRLFDLKRLNIDPVYQTTLVRYGQNGTTIATLSPNNNRYVFPFAPIVVANNSNIVQNPR